MKQIESADFAIILQQQVYQLVKNYEGFDRICLSQYGVTASQGYALMFLPQEGNLSMNDLSEVMGIANSTMTRVIDPLVKKGLVQRAPDDEDRRIVRVSLTAAGQGLRLTLEKAAQGFFQQALANIQESERENILYALEQVNRAMAGCCAMP